MWESFLLDVFGGDSPERPLALHQVAARAALMYIAGLVIVRVGKSRLIGRTSSLDVILGFILGSVLSRGITGSASLSETVVATAALVAAHYSITALTCRYHALGQLIKGNAIVLVRDGKVDDAAMRQSHFSQRDLKEELRLNGNIEDLAQVAVAYKERSGEIGVVKR